MSFKRVALPAEHGSWSLVVEPILLGLLAAPSWVGAILAISAFSVFMAKRPLTIYYRDRRRGRIFNRTAVALRYGLLFLGLALAGGLAALYMSGPQWLLAVFLALPFGAVFLVYDSRPNRTWQAELSAPVAFSAVAAAIAMASGWSWVPALALWGIMITRAVPAILYVRARLRLDKDKEIRRDGVAVLHLAAVAAVAALYWLDLAPATAVLAMAILLARAVWGLSDWRRRMSIKAFGFLETGFGLLTAALVGIGYWLPF